MLYTGHFSAAQTAAVRRAVAISNLPSALVIIFTDFFCDVFLSMHIIYMACFTIACAMIVTIQVSYQGFSSCYERL